MFRRRLFCLAAVLVLVACCCVPAFALNASTLRHGSRGSAVRQVQEALITLGYMKGPADGIFGNKTENAVRKFQRAKKLKVDGMVGPKTLQVLMRCVAEAAPTPAPTAAPTPTPAPTPTATPAPTADGNLFSGNYAAIQLNDTGRRVRILQNALISLKYMTGKADGVFGSKTQKAVQLFQTQNNLTADGIAGKKTLKALEKAVREGAFYSAVTPTPTPTSTPTPVPTEDVPDPPGVAMAPDGSVIRLLHWFNDIKGTLKNGDHLLIYDPSTKISWTLRVYSRGRHCDSEPLTLADTQNMVRAFSGVNTWNQKGVYVKLPSGIWTIGSTHDMPHMSGSIRDNGFNGHLCVHFLRDMAEAKKNDPKYGVANQETIRALWKTLTGETISY